MGRIETQLAPTDPEELLKGSPMPGQVKGGRLVKAAIGDRGIREQQMTTDHQIETGVRQAKIRQGPSPVALRMQLTISQKALQRAELAATVTIEIESGPRGG